MIMLEILSSLIPLAIVIGLVVLVVRLVAKKKPADQDLGGETAGVVLRRLFVYMTMLVTLTLSAIGVAGLIDTVTEWGTVTRSADSTALFIAFVVVALPVFSILAFSTRRRLRDDPTERTSTGWAFYLTVVLTGSLVAAMVLVGGLIVELFDGLSLDGTLLVNAVVWTSIWAAHWRVMRRESNPVKMQLAMVAGSGIGFVAVASGAGGLVAAILDDLYSGWFLTSLIEPSLDPIVGSLVVLAVGAPVWWLYWFRNTLTERRTPMWLAYVLLFGVLGAAITVITGVGITIFGVLQWLIGTPDAGAAAQFAFLPGAIAAISVGAAGWGYHGRVLGERDDRRRTEVDRVYDYLLAGSGLVVAAGGLATLVSIGIDAVGAREIASSTTGNAAAAAITLLVVGVPLWWRYWSTIQRYRREDPTKELISPTRRTYLFLLFGLSGLIAIVDLVVLVTMALTDLLEGSFGAATLSDIAVPIALLVTTGAIAWYHFVIFREDRAEAPEPARAVLREVILVSSDGHDLVAALTASTEARVQTLHKSGNPVRAGSIDQVLEDLAVESHTRVVVVDDEDAGYQIIALDA